MQMKNNSDDRNKFSYSLDEITKENEYLLFTSSFKYTRLYSDILKIGVNHAFNGITYNELIKKLKSKGHKIFHHHYEDAIIQCFLYNFEHYIMNSDHKIANIDINEFAKHRDCHFILKSSSLFDYINYTTAKRNNNIALIALFISVIALIFTFVSYYKDPDIDYIEVNRLVKNLNTEKKPEVKEVLQNLNKIDYRKINDIVLRIDSIQRRNADSSLNKPLRYKK